MPKALLYMLLVCAWASSAVAVLIDTPDGTGNTNPPAPDPGWNHVGKRGGLTAVYLGNGVALTANHVGVGDLLLGGELVPAVPGSGVRLSNPDGTLADLLLFAVYPAPDVPPLALVDAPPLEGTSLVLAGNGRNRGDAISWDPNGPPPPGPYTGYAWAAGGALRWGTNELDSYTPAKVLGTYALITTFDLGDTAYEAQAVPGDSGGAVFAWSGAGWELAGIIYAIGEYGGQPAQTSIEGQITYAADLSVYRTEIENRIALPEPAGALGVGALLATALARVRRR